MLTSDGTAQCAGHVHTWNALVRTACRSLEPSVCFALFHKNTYQRARLLMRFKGQNATFFTMGSSGAGDLWHTCELVALINTIPRPSPLVTTIYSQPL